MIRILLCSEGKTEHGSVKYQDGAYTPDDGVMQIILQKLAENITIMCISKKRSDIEHFRLLPPKRNFERHQHITARRLAAITQYEECDFIAYHRDEDNKGFQEMYAQVKGNFTVAEEKGIPCLAIVPMHMTESWLLSDANAFPLTPDKPPLPRKPEETWGATGSDRHPKKYLERVLKQFHLHSSTEAYCEIARNSSISIMRNRCPVSFGRLCEDMEELLTEKRRLNNLVWLP